MQNTAPISIIKHFEDIHDPRVDRSKKYKLTDILFLSLTAILCGADTFVEIENFGNASLPFFSGYINTENGIPSHDTIGRVFSSIKPQEFQNSFLYWISDVVKNTKGKVVAIDGKSIRGVKNPIHMVNVWVAENSVLFGQAKVSSKQNEIVAINKLLEILDLEGAIVTIDAMGCQKNIVEKICAQKADYVIALKANQKNLLEDTKAFFDSENLTNGAVFDTSETVEKSRNRFEKRVCTTTQADEILKYVNKKDQWKNLNTLIKLASTRKIKGKTSYQERYFISSLNESSEVIASIVRKHWSVENNLHWVLDISFREDETLARVKHAAENLSLVKKIVLSLIKQDKSKGSMKSKRNRAGWNIEFREMLLGLISG